MLLAEIGRPQGLGGEVRLRSFTGEPRDVATYGPLIGTGGRRVEILSCRPAPGDRPDLLVARIAGVADRTAAEALTGERLYVARDKLGEAGEDEFFLVDLVGLRAEDETGEVLGRVVAVPDYGGGELIEIAPEHGATRLVPFSRACVPLVDIARGRIVVVPPVEVGEQDDAAEDGIADA